MDMRRARTKLEPWIEKTIINHGTDQEASGHLKAHVIGVGQMSHSQAQGREGPTGLLFLSDGVVHIPAALTEAAWEHLQEQEDRECFTSLLNTTVLLQAYSVHFHMDAEKTRCRFFVSVGKLATTAAGPVKDRTPCCTSLSSVSLKIYKTWRALKNQDSVSHPASQCAFDLSTLLGEWQNNCLEDLMEDVEKRLVALRSTVTPRPSTSSSTPTSNNMYMSTGWDVDRVRYKGETPFSIPASHLLIPDEGVQEQPERQVPPAPPIPEGSETLSGLVSFVDDRGTISLPAAQRTEPCPHVAAVVVAVEEKEGQMARSPETRPEEQACSQRDSVLLSGEEVAPRRLSNPWDIFPPPCDVLCTSSSSDTSVTLEPILPQPPLLQAEIGLQAEAELPAEAEVGFQAEVELVLDVGLLQAKVGLLPAVGLLQAEAEVELLPEVGLLPAECVAISTQVSSDPSQQSFLPAFQKPPATGTGPVPTSWSTTSGGEPQCAAEGLSPLSPIVASGTHPSQPPLQTPVPEEPPRDASPAAAERGPEANVSDEDIRRRCGKAKRKRSWPFPDAAVEEEEEADEGQVALSPPSWLFETQAVSGAEAGRTGLPPDRPAGTVVLRKGPAVHSDGSRFSYTYKVYGQNLQDLSKFEVTDDLLHWAVKYLVTPKQTNCANGLVC